MLIQGRQKEAKGLPACLLKMNIIVDSGCNMTWYILSASYAFFLESIAEIGLGRETTGKGNFEQRHVCADKKAAGLFDALCLHKIAEGLAGDFFERIVEICRTKLYIFGNCFKG